MKMMLKIIQILLIGKIDMKSNLYYYNRDYSEKRRYEWYLSYPDFSHLVSKVVLREDKILHVGAGTSSKILLIDLSFDMEKDGYSNIVSTDISDNCIEFMNERVKTKGKNLSYLKSNVTNMNFENESFDVVVEKGLLDSLLCKENGIADAEQMIKEIYRVLGKRGRYLSISHSSERSVHFKCQTWDIQVIPLSLKNAVEFDKKENNKLNNKQEKAEHYLYVMTK